MQLFIPPILIFNGLMMRRTWRASAAQLPDIFRGHPVKISSAQQKSGLLGRSFG
jgi:hypothetical protein